ncbi:exodeoxyribonuclease VII large subunit [Ralstonia pseudosolanacearum]|uniref:Exodeoxyribonuclease 7 large subunit n=1 Tax=Ralstonia solanacearum TaxID=305 RepID=A0AA92IDR8_RALSL|nr:exodeoxyribonuclease VII large subunit [Ralstonia pseudosolanacearum]QCX48784.1 exodeoxyribonuclease VII large subunit [Ralstonia pseudosolanacearum]
MDTPAAAPASPSAVPAPPPTSPVGPGRGGQEVLSVSEVNRRIAGLLERHFALGWVRGEISNFTRAGSGHWYFSLKDAGAQIRCVMFKGRNQYADFTPREGEAVEVRALVTLYEARGELQLSVEAIRRAGLGNLYEAFLRLKAALEAQGLFDAARKRPLPRHPHAIGVVTSLQAAALRDVLTTLHRRAPHVPVVVYPVPVQGAGAAERIAAMLDLVNARAEVDVIILCRGGGSIEDLWAFNEEPVARAVAASDIPIVAGVGHETDVTIVDFVADVRAPTPTGAAELVSPDRARMLRDVAGGWDALSATLRRQLDRRAQTVDWLARRLRSPQAQMRERRAGLAHLEGRLRFALRGRVQHAEHGQRLLAMRLDAARPDIARERTALQGIEAALARAMRATLDRAQTRLSHHQAGLELLAPQRTLERGYAVLLDAKGQAIRDPAALHARARIEARLARGAVDIEIAQVQPKLPEM